MVDVYTKAKRSWVMSRIRGKDTRPERAVRSFLHRSGFRFRLHGSWLPGRPDVVLPKYRAVVFVNGCFFHGHPGCKRATTPATNRVFWTRKIARNRRRDAAVHRALRKAGWRVVTVWECQVGDPTRLRSGLRQLFTLKEGLHPIG